CPLPPRQLHRHRPERLRQQPFCCRREWAPVSRWRASPWGRSSPDADPFRRVFRHPRATTARGCRRLWVAGARTPNSRRRVRRDVTKKHRRSGGGMSSDVRWDTGETNPGGNMGSRKIRVGIDTGGTFTDVVAVDDESGAIVTTKPRSTPQDPAIGFLAGIEKVLAQLGETGD